MSLKKLICNLKLVTTFKDGSVIVSVYPAQEARDMYRYLCGVYIDYGYKCIKSVSLCDSRFIILRQLNINY